MFFRSRLLNPPDFFTVLKYDGKTIYTKDREIKITLVIIIKINCNYNIKCCHWFTFEVGWNIINLIVLVKWIFNLRKSLFLQFVINFVTYDSVSQLWLQVTFISKMGLHLVVLTISLAFTCYWIDPFVYC